MSVNCVFCICSGISTLYYVKYGKILPRDSRRTAINTVLSNACICLPMNSHTLERRPKCPSLRSTGIPFGQASTGNPLQTPTPFGLLPKAGRKGTPRHCPPDPRRIGSTEIRVNYNTS